MEAIDKCMGQPWVQLPPSNKPGPAQGIVGPKTTTLSDVYFYTLNVNRIFI